MHPAEQAGREVGALLRAAVFRLSAALIAIAAVATIT